MKPISEAGATGSAGESAIERVLAAERDARLSVECARIEVGQIAETARSVARSWVDRTERRVRGIVGAFERELAASLAEIDAEAERLGSPQPLTSEERDALQRAVEALARELIGVRP